MNDPISLPVALSRAHRTDEFASGEAALDQWLQCHALASQAAGGARSFVICQGTCVIGFYSLAAGSIRPPDAPARLAQGLGRHPIPIILLARLGVDQRAQGQGIGNRLLWDAVTRFLAVSNIIGCRALLTHAKHDRAATFYHARGFEPFPDDPLRLYLLLKDARATLDAR